MAATRREHPAASCRAAREAAKAQRKQQDLEAKARRLQEYQAKQAAAAELRVRAGRSRVDRGLAPRHVGSLHYDRACLPGVAAALLAAVLTSCCPHPPRAPRVAQAAAKAQRLKREELRLEVMDVAREERRRLLLRQSCSWVTEQTLDQRIEEALDNPVPLHADTPSGV